jgi:threonylcarbamoyladenosine tRNA methylthiotransferase MtaB
MKIFLDSIGCRLNQSEIEKMALQFRQAGYDLVDDASLADLVVVNTCAVTSAASSDSRQHIRQAAKVGNARIVATGCWATIDPQSASKLPLVALVVDNLHKQGLVKDILGKDENSPINILLPRTALPGLRKRTRAFIKIQDGCNNHCSYCITRIARGKSRSQSLEEILSDIQSAIDGGVKEIVLTGAQLGSWGKDLEPKMKLTDLINIVFQNTSIERLRLSSIEPWEINEDYLAVLQNKRFCQHLHLPLQSGSAEILKRMTRQMTPEKFSDLVLLLRNAYPELSITTDLIVGFPGETETEFNENLEFIQKMNFAGGHVFSFSPRPETSAALLPDPVHQRIKKERSKLLRSYLTESANQYRNKFLRQNIRVLWEKSERTDRTGWRMEGLTDNYLRVFAFSETDRWNQFSDVRLLNVEEKLIKGSINQVDYLDHKK